MTGKEKNDYFSVFLFGCLRNDCSSFFLAFSVVTCIWNLARKANRRMNFNQWTMWESVYRWMNRNISVSIFIAFLVAYCKSCTILVSTESLTNGETLKNNSIVSPLTENPISQQCGNGSLSSSTLRFLLSFNVYFCGADILSELISFGVLETSFISLWMDWVKKEGYYVMHVSFFFFFFFLHLID